MFGFAWGVRGELKKWPNIMSPMGIAVSPLTGDPLVAVIFFTYRACHILTFYFRPFSAPFSAIQKNQKSRVLECSTGVNKLFINYNLSQPTSTPAPIFFCKRKRAARICLIRALFAGRPRVLRLAILFLDHCCGFLITLNQNAIGKNKFKTAVIKGASQNVREKIRSPRRL